MTEARPFSEVTRLVDAGDVSRLEELGPGPFLIEIPTQSPLGYGAPQASPGTAAQTAHFDEQLLLDLRRSRATQGARLHRLPASGLIGRSSRCDIQLPDEESVSKEHARFEQADGGWQLVDLGTTNGTFVNRKRLTPGTPAALSSLASVQVGSRRFAFLDAQDLVALLQPVALGAAVTIDQLRTELEALGSKRFRLRHGQPFLLVAYKGEGSRSPTDFTPSEAFALSGDGPLRIGRTGEAELTLRRSSVSKWHASLEREGSGWAIRDTASSNGTLVNGVRLAAGELKRLASWDALGFGRSTWALYMEPRALLEWLLEAEQ
jgi:pSer/pThr/pTyr-binding forkhead associated (FHA) protein